MGEVVTGHGDLAGLCGHDGTNWEKVLIDATKRLVVAIASCALPTGAATAANQTTMITALQLIDDLRNALDSVGADELDVNVEASVLPTGAATQTTLASCLTALELIDDLRGALDSVDTDELVVNVDESVLPTGAATSANQTTMITALQLIDDLRAALHSVAGDELDVIVESSALPTGAATSANQTTMITALQLIDDLRAALNSVATDELDVVIDGQSADVEVTQTTPADLVVGQHQYDGAAWRKSNMVFGYHDRLVEDVRDMNLGAGTQSMNGTAVPAGEVWVVQCVNGYVLSGTCTRMSVRFNMGGDIQQVINEVPPTSGYYYVLSGEWVLKEGDYVTWYGTGLTAGDDGVMTYSGYKMDISM